MKRKRPSRAKPVSDEMIAHLSSLPPAEISARIARLREVDPGAFMRLIAAVIEDDG